MQSGGDAARSTLLAAIDLARRVGDADLLARAALSLGGFGLSPGMVDDDLVAVLEEALRALPPDGSALRARLLVRLAVALYYSDAAQRREDLVQEALGIARGLDDTPTLAYVLEQGHIATNGPDTAERGVAWAQELFALADDADDPELSVRARSWQIDLLLELDDIAGADMAIEELDRIATDSRDPRARAYIPLHRARRAMISGQPRRHRGPHPRGHPAGLEPAGLDRPDPRRRPALLAAHRARGACASSRTPCASSPTSSRPCPPGASRSPRSTCTPAARRRRAASTTASPSATSRRSRATTSGRSPSRCWPS